MQALLILCIPYPFLDFHALAPIQDKEDPKCNIKQDISGDTFVDFDEFSSNRDNLDPYCNTNEINNDISLDFEGFTPVQDKLIYVVAQNNNFTTTMKKILKNESLVFHAPISKEYEYLLTTYLKMEN